jgi:glycosyltransferase involved in cell wall biosynthesis
MVFISVSYNYSPEFDSPENWFKRAQIYNGILEHLSGRNTVINVKQINYIGNHTHKGVHHKFVDFGKKKTFFPLRFNRFIKSLNPDIILFQGLHHPFQLIQLRFLLNKKVKIIAHHHAEKPFTGLKKYLQKIADRCVDAYLFASHEIGMDWVNRGNLLSPEKIHEVMEVSSVFYPIEKTIARSKTGAFGDPVFLWVGRLNANKDPFTVIKAFLRFAELHPNATLYMIYHTDDLLPDIIEFLKDHSYKDNIILIGKVPNNDLLYWYNSADFIISGSHYEGSGTAIAEAMSCGCIPVVTDIFSFRMITDNGKCGFLYKAGDEIALLATLINLKHINLAEKKAASLAYFKSNLSFDAIAAKIQEIASSL